MKEFLELLWVLLLAGGAVVLVVLALVFGLQIPLERAVCAGFARESGYRTKYVNLGLGTYHCMVKLPSGHWIDSNNLRNDSK